MANGECPSSRKDRIVLETYALILEHGITGATTARIAARSGVTEAALYHHFKNRRDILMAVLDLAEERFLQVLMIEQDNVVEYILTLYRYILSHPEDAKVIYAFYESRRAAHVQEPGTDMQHKLKDMLVILEHLLVKGISQGTIRSDIIPRRIAWELISLGFTMSFATLLDFQHERTEGLSMASIEQFLDRIKT